MCGLQQNERNIAPLLYPGDHRPGCRQLKRGGSMGQGKRDGWLDSWADTSAESAQLVGGTAGLSTSEPQFLLL